MQINWVGLKSVLAMHDYQIRAHGGGQGIRDQGLLESALARAENKYFYGGEGAPDIPALAAAYAYGIARNHCFIDGNKRTAMMVSFSFVERNFHLMTATEEEAYAVFLALGAGDMDEEELTQWFRDYTEYVGKV